MNRSTFLVVFFCIIGLTITYAQGSFPSRCQGTWKGMMYLYRHGKLMDSVKVRLTVEKSTPDSWSWKTEYLSPQRPMVKDYVMRVKDAANNIYITDEGEGIELTDYLYNNKLYSVFETEGILLTSSYELVGTVLIFEVTSGKKPIASDKPVLNYAVDNLQRVVFTRE